MAIAHIGAYGQIPQPDSSTSRPMPQKEARLQREVDDSLWLKVDSSRSVKKHSPRKATIYSTILPGLGQVYNRQYWKVPVLAGLGTFFCIMISSNNFDLNQANNDYNKRLFNISDGYVSAKKDAGLYDAYDGANPNLSPGDPTYETNTLKLIRDGYRRERDFYIIMSVVTYALNIVDATVFAHLREFELSTKLSMKIEPDIRLGYGARPITGLSCSLYFR